MYSESEYFTKIFETMEIKRDYSTGKMSVKAHELGGGSTLWRLTNKYVTSGYGITPFGSNYGDMSVER